MTVIFYGMIHDCLNVVKSKEERHHSDELKKVFTRRKQYNLRMNPLKCAFSVSSRKFSGFIVHMKGSDVDPAKAKVIRDMEFPTTCK